MSERTPLLNSQASSPPPEDDSLLANTKGISHFRMLLLMFAVYFCTYLVALDTTVVSTLLAHIASDLKQLDNISWVATGYLIAYSAFQPLYGKLSDIFGRKKVMIFCSLMFGAGCQVCGIAHSLEVLVAGRFISGVGAGGMLSTGTITVSDYVPLRKRGVFQGIGNVCFAIGASSGGIIGGWATKKSDWRMAFLIQVPMTLVAVAIIAWIIVDKKEENVKTSDAIKRIDFVGAVTLVSGLLLFMFAVTTGGNQFKWTSFTIIASLVASMSFLIGFFKWEKYYAVEPILPIDILLDRTVISACLTNFFSSGVAYSFMYYGPVVLASLFDIDYQDLSSRVITNFIGVACGSLGSGIYMRKFGKYKTIGVGVCLLMMVSAIQFLILVMLPPSIGSSAILQCFTYFVQGFGYAGMLTISLVALIAAVEPNQQATSTSAQYTFRGAGSSVGIALAASIFQNVLQQQLHKRVYGKHSKRAIREVLKSVEAIRMQPKRFIQPIIDSYRVAAIAVFLFCLVFVTIATVCMCFVEEHELEKKTIDVAAEQQLLEPESVTSA